jgi:uncharacterized membrane protein (UPF0136 family)
MAMRSRLLYVLSILAIAGVVSWRTGDWRFPLIMSVSFLLVEVVSGPSPQRTRNWREIVPALACSIALLAGGYLYVRWTEAEVRLQAAQILLNACGCPPGPAVHAPAVKP